MVPAARIGCRDGGGASGGLRFEQQTSQDYFRLYLGPEIGSHGYGFFRPHVGAHIALVNHGISTDVVVPDDIDREKEIGLGLNLRNWRI